MTILNQPTYPVLDRAPGFWKTFGGFNLTDYAKWLGCTAACWPYGYVTGLNAGIPKQSAAMAAILGATGGFMLAYQSSSGRMMGYLPNDKEVDSALRH